MKIAIKQKSISIKFSYFINILFKHNFFLLNFQIESTTFHLKSTTFIAHTTTSICKVKSSSIHNKPAHKRCGTG